MTGRSHISERAFSFSPILSKYATDFAYMYIHVHVLVWDFLSMQSAQTTLKIYVPWGKHRRSRW